mmetsp:Transcript_27837/g.50339  ORF Transcript_27837/g.50339 Transcript_27837/m.50339 type:complete len:299 (+) Transcript_27837:59-955(+)
MPSRKRNKGKARKTLKVTSSGDDHQPVPQSYQHGKEEVVPPRDEQQPRLQQRQHECDLISPINACLLFRDALEAQQVGLQCRHGCDSVPRTHACFLLKVALDAEIIEQLSNGKSLIESLIRSFRIATQRCPRVLDDRSTRESMKALFLAIGTESVQSWGAGPYEQVNTAYCAGAVIFLEEYEGLDFQARCIKLKMRLDDVFGGGERGATLFFSKRTPCSCLDQKKRLLKPHPKMSVCCVCNESKDCKTLRRCGGCNIVQYCSEKCQKADWPMHKGHCEKLSSYMKKGTKPSTSAATEI